MNTPQDATFEISYLKVLLITIPSWVCFAIAIFIEGIPMGDPLLVGFLVFMFSVMPFIFAICFCFMLRCKIGYDGLRSPVPFYQRVLRWDDIAVVQGFCSPFYFVRSRAFGGGHCILPRRFLLKRPDSLKELIEQYAPADNIVRKKLEA